MNRYLSLVCLILMLFVPTGFATEIVNPDQIVQRTYDRDLGDDMQMRGVMELVSDSGHTRVREFVSYRKDIGETRMNMIRFLSPKDIEGTAFLNIEKEGSSKTEQHLYLPALKRTRRIVASQKGRSFVNSDFSYEDMQRHPVADWTYQLQGNEQVLGHATYVLVGTPKPGTDTQYSKLVSWIEHENFMPLKSHFFDKKGRHSKTYTVQSFRMIDSIATETEVVMEDLLSGHKTRLKTLEIQYNIGLDEALFSTRALER